MTMWNRNQQSQVQWSRTPSRWSTPGALLFLCLLFTTVSAAERVRTVGRYSLSSSWRALIGSEGTLELKGENPEDIILRGNLDPLADSRRRRRNSSSPKTFSRQVQEGQVGGHRGFSARADDDADGRMDEDPLDGLDNDGDGRIDEDFAAISDAMTVVHLSQGDGNAQLEFMQWAGPRLQNALFLGISATHELGAGLPLYYHLESQAGAWRQIDAFSRRDTPVGGSRTDRATAFVVKVDAAESSDGSWLGIMVLDQSARTQGRARLRPVLDGGQLSLPLNETPLHTVICTASSWLQLNRLLLESKVIFEGVSDPVSNRRVPWIVSPLCSRCRQENSLDFQVEKNTEDELVLRLRLSPGPSGLVDPDLFLLAGVPLGSPRKIIWEATDQPATETPWGEVTNAILDGNLEYPLDLYGLLGVVPSHEAQGDLFFVFSNPAGKGSGWFDQAKDLNLTGTWLDGRNFSALCPVVLDSRLEGVASNALAPTSVKTPGPEGISAHDGRLSLAPGLLEGWPNPFRDQIRIEFVIPATIRETFDWTGDKPLPQGVDLSAPMAWQTGLPTVSVKVYSINGQELVSLQEGSLGEGRYSVSWNGTDATGRKVASGTYFCKLQMDEWSVTRRLVFIR